LDYLNLKHVHMGCAAVSGSLFLLRGIWMLRDSPRLQQRWVRTAPHVVDTLLLGSAGIWRHRRGRHQAADAFRPLRQRRGQGVIATFNTPSR
jgi:hypothetical protein